MASSTEFASSTWRPAYENLQIKIVNIGKRSATVSSVEILYGPEPLLAKCLISYSGGLPKKLEDGDELPVVTIRRNELVSAANQEVHQSHKHRIWVSVHLSTGTRVSRVVSIDPSIIPKPYWDREEPYLASDLFLGFPPMAHRIKNL